MELRLPRATLRFDRPLLMGVVNVTPDSFSDGGRFLDPLAAIAHGERLITEGADLLDIGGESSRPGATPVSINTELERILPVIEGLADRGVPLCIDTTKLEVAERALAAGAQIVNDINGLQDERLLAVASRYGAAAIAMHKKGDPRTMQQAPQYVDVVGEVLAFLRQAVDRARRRGVEIVVDPGIGFGKNLGHNLALLAATRQLVDLGVPVLIGVSRKSFINRLAGALETEPHERLPGSLAAGLVALAGGAHILRVHDVAAHRQFLAVHQHIEQTLNGPSTSGSAAFRKSTQSPVTQSPVIESPVIESPVITRLVMKRLRLEANIGVSDEERANKQVVFVDLEAQLPRPPLPRQTGRDELTTTVDYVSVAEHLRARALARPFHLLETLGEELLDAATELGLEQVRIALDKPAINKALGGERVGVTIERQKGPEPKQREPSS